MLKTPVLLITFNRPEHTQKVFEAIKKQKPLDLYVFQDGAREDNINDISKCKTVRTIFEQQIDWECEFHTYYSEKNLGCGPGPASGISWFFEHVEQGIIIEDDAIPADDFFSFAEELLNKYKDETDVRVISSIKILDKKYGDGSYYFSSMNRNLCAWATWRRAWKDFDITLKGLTKKELFRTYKRYRMTYLEREFWYERILEIQKDGMKNSSWDIQFCTSVLLNNGKGICPNANLSVNIGFDEDATHRWNKRNPLAIVKNESILPLVHPTVKKIYREADFAYQKKFHAPYEYGFSGFKRIPHRINKRIKRFLKYEGSWLQLRKK